MDRRDYYVYELALDFPEDSPLFPLSGWVFYVGKGTGARIDQHEKETRLKLIGRARRKRNGLGEYTHKHKMILLAWDHAGRVIKNKVATRLTEEEAYAIEAERINIYGMEYLTNEALPRKPKRKTPR